MRLKRYPTAERLTFKRCFRLARLVWFSLLLAGGALAQTGLEQMRNNLAEGAYALAAQITGPNLVRDLPDSPEAHYLYAYALYLTDDLEGARSELELALSLGPQPADPQYDRLNGLLRAREGDTEGALRLLKNAFVRSQDYAIAMDWGAEAWRAGRFEDALEAYAAASGTAQGQVELWPQLNSGRILDSQGDFEAAMEAFSRAIKVYDTNDDATGLASPGVVQAYFLLGRAHEAKEAFDLAKVNYQAALNLDPNYRPAQDALADLALR